MHAASQPEDETERLVSLRLHNLLDTPPDPRFDKLTRLAATLFDVPIAHVSLMDADRQWLKSAVGLRQGMSTARADTFCAETICDTLHPTIVEDARLDPRFAHLPAVAGYPFVRFYAGVPLLDTEGRGLGAFCIIDVKPRRFSATDLDQLVAIATGVSNAIELALSKARQQDSDALAWGMFAATSSALALLDQDGTMVQANGGHGRIFGETHPGEPWVASWPDETRDALLAGLAQARAGTTTRLASPGPLVANAPSWWDIVMAPLPAKPGIPLHILCSARNVTEARREREALANASAMLQSVLESTTDHVFLVDSDWRITYLNGHAQTLVGDGRQLIGMTLLDAFPEAEGSLFEQQIRYAAHARVSVLFKDFLTSRRLWLEVHAHPTALGLSIFFRDVTERQRIQADLIRLAEHDSLTGLANRHMFRQRLGVAVAAKDPVAVLLIDVDHFKNVNDTRGHPAGDALLCQAADRLRGILHGADVVARVGGDEFAVVLSGAGHANAAAALSSRIVADFALAFDIEGSAFTCGASIGIALSDDARQDPDQMMKNADLALYAAKAAGRGTHRFFTADMAQHAATAEAMKSLLRHALTRQEMSVQYQPVMDLHGGGVVGFEALLRWTRGDAAVAPPGMFIPIAEETGLIIPIGTWALRTACLEAASWPDPVWVAVNLSPLQFRDPGLVHMVSAALADSGLPARRLELEITETALLRYDDATLDALTSLRALGVRIALDDFGTGYASLGYVNNFPFDKIKVDRMFIRDLPSSAESTAIVRAVTSMGRSLGMTITAEGVETRAQQEAVRMQGCGQAQGYYFSAAVPATEAMRMVAPCPEKRALG
jgi:diguanylate cyclase (GGDEF)-like protein/PAS domain S-box-containing protein